MLLTRDGTFFYYLFKVIERLIEAHGSFALGVKALLTLSHFPLVLLLTIRKLQQNLNFGHIYRKKIILLKNLFDCEKLVNNKINCLSFQHYF